MPISLLAGGVSVGAFCRRPSTPNETPSFRYRTRSVGFPNRPTRFRCSAITTTANPNYDLHKSVLTQNDVGFSLAKRLISGEAESWNMVFSPLSISAVLSLIAAGAGGPAKEQLLSFLGPRVGSGGHVAEEARYEVNSWAEKKTRGLIKDVLPRYSVGEFTELVCANALYFKGTWVEKFDESRTRNHDFYLLDGSSMQARFITNHENQSFRAYDGFKVLRLPYRRGQDTLEFSMYLILPDAIDGLPDLAHRVCSQSGFLESHIPERRVRLSDFRIPKFKACFQFEASHVLKSLGLVLPFDDGLTEMVESSRLFVSSIRHKASVEVDERGTEAAAVTTPNMLGSSPYSDNSTSFVADRPFMYVIREDSTGAVLFIGQVLNPAKSD